MAAKKIETDQPVTRVITNPDMSAVLQVQQAMLKVVEGPDQGLEVPLGESGVLVGTAEDCQLILSDTAVSRHHMEITVGEEGFRLRDLGSSNGIKISGLKISDATLGSQHDIHVGASKLHFSTLEGHNEFPLSSKTSFGSLMGRSLAMRRVFAIFERAANSETTLLFTGESGTGKDLAAENIHLQSARSSGPFVVVDCGAMQSTLVEGELFGHAKGAFTGADRDRPGAIESANGGTIFLDEIGEIDPSLQPKLLRLLEKKEIKRLGENRYRPVDVRVLAATNRDLAIEVAAGRFREDLFYRLGVVQVEMPALRKKREDIAMLARNFVQKLKPELDPLEVVSDQVLSLLLNHDWPGNVRELRNVVERLLLFPDYPQAALSPTGSSSEESVGEFLDRPFHEARRRCTERFERAYLTTILDSCNGVVSQAAKAADIPRQTFHRLMSKHQLVK